MNISRFFYHGHLENAKKVMNIRSFDHRKSGFFKNHQKNTPNPRNTKFTIVLGFKMIVCTFISISWPFHEQRTLNNSNFITFALTPTNVRSHTLQWFALQSHGLCNPKCSQSVTVLSHTMQTHYPLLVLR